MCARIALITEVLLVDEELAGAVEHQAALRLWRLGLDEPHIGVLVTASQMASASAASFFCRLT
jgi:hypothetical protein